MVNDEFDIGWGFLLAAGIFSLCEASGIVSLVNWLGDFAGFEF